MSCEEKQIEISAWLDGEVAPWDALPLADHLVGCAACAAFYTGARRLDRSLAMGATAAPARPPAWSPDAPAPARPPRRASWALPLAATLLLAAGGYALGRQTLGAARPAARLGGPMTDDRFVGIARELLASEPRYRTEMLRVMTAVTESRPLEGSVDARPAAPPASGEGGARPALVPGS